MNELISFIMSKLNYWVYIALMMIGLYAMIAKKNLVKKIIGMNILQTAVILFFISIGAKKDASIPIIVHGHAAESHAARAAEYINPLPHVLMLTAIVVAVATLVDDHRGIAGVILCGIGGFVVITTLCDGKR